MKNFLLKWLQMQHDAKHLYMQFKGAEAQHKQTCVVICRNPVCNVDCFCKKKTCTMSCYSTFQAVENSTNKHHNDATGHACAVGVHQ